LFLDDPVAALGPSFNNIGCLSLGILEDLTGEDFGCWKVISSFRWEDFSSTISNHLINTSLNTPHVIPMKFIEFLDLPRIGIWGKINDSGLVNHGDVTLAWVIGELPRW
jgi:hypothetical protein